MLLKSYVQVYPGVGYTAFLVPGLVMMSLLQNSFANSSVFPDPVENQRQSGLHTAFAHLALGTVSRLYACLYRERTCGRNRRIRGNHLVCTTLLLFTALVVLFALLGSAILGTMGIIAGIWADKYEQLATFQNFLIMPATFLSGVFYSIHTLPPVWQRISEFNPFFYMVDGFRYGFSGIRTSIR